MDEIAVDERGSLSGRGEDGCECFDVSLLIHQLKKFELDLVSLESGDGELGLGDERQELRFDFF